MTPERIERLRNVLNKRQPDMTVVTDFVHKSRNLSAIVRTADAVGIHTLYSVIEDKDFHAFCGTAKGSHRWVEVIRRSTIKSAIDPLKAMGMQIIAADITENSQNYRNIDYTQPFALVLGAERKGLSELVRAEVDQFVTVPMMGMVESFNVSVAAAIILIEAMNQRMDKGFYDAPRISDAEYQRLFFEWGHPQIRDFCKQRNLAYPLLNDDGEINNLSAWYARIREQQS